MNKLRRERAALNLERFTHYFLSLFPVIHSSQTPPKMLKRQQLLRLLLVLATFIIITPASATLTLKKEIKIWNSCLAKLKLCFSIDQPTSTQAEKSRLLRGNVSIIHSTPPLCPLTWSAPFSLCLGLKSAFYYVVPCTLWHLPDTCQRSDSWLSPKIFWQVWIQRGCSGEGVPSWAAGGGSAHFYMQMAKQKPQRAPQRKIKPVQSF